MPRRLPIGGGGSVTGLSRPALAVIGLLAGFLAVCLSWILDGASSFCGLDENQAATGYCAAGSSVQIVLVALPAATVVVGYAVSLTMARLTPVLLAAACAVAEGLLVLVSGW
jgi:hypothetical protein